MNLGLKAIKIYKYTISFFNYSLSFQRFNRSCEKWRLYSFVILLSPTFTIFYILFIYIARSYGEKLKD